jgi:hypothetical protein
MDTTITPRDYIKQNYDPNDRLAVVIKNHLTGKVINASIVPELLLHAIFKAGSHFIMRMEATFISRSMPCSRRPTEGPARRSKPSVTFISTSIRMDRLSLPRS